MKDESDPKIFSGDTGRVRDYAELMTKYEAMSNMQRILRKH